VVIIKFTVLFGCKPSGLVKIRMFQCKGSSMKTVAAVCGGQNGTGTRFSPSQRYTMATDSDIK